MLDFLESTRQFLVAIMDKLVVASITKQRAPLVPKSIPRKAGFSDPLFTAETIIVIRFGRGKAVGGKVKGLLR